MARAFGSYPKSHRFKSCCRHQYGPLVKGLRHRPFTAKTRVRFPCGSPRWDLSSAGRAPASHAGGRRFKPGRSHHSEGFPVDNGQMPLLRWQGAESTSPRRMPLSCGINSVVECHLAKVKVASSNLVSRSKKDRPDQAGLFIRHHSQVVRQRSAKPLFSGSNPDGASKPLQIRSGWGGSYL